MAEELIATQRSAWGFSTAGPEQSWRDEGLCAQADPEAWYPEKGGSTREAKRVCMGCPVRQECLDFALDHDERFGIWGGLSERERRRLKRGEHVTPAIGGGPIHKPSEHAYQRGCVCDGCLKAHEAHLAA